MSGELNGVQTEVKGSALDAILLLCSQAQSCAYSCHLNFCGFRIKKLFNTLLYRKRACSECRHHWRSQDFAMGEGRVENDITFNYTLYAGADPESFGGVHAILN